MEEKCECTKLKDAVAHLFYSWLMYGHKHDKTLDAMLNVFSEMDSKTKKEITHTTSRGYEEE